MSSKAVIQLSYSTRVSYDSARKRFHREAAFHVSRGALLKKPLQSLHFAAGLISHIRDNLRAQVDLNAESEGWAKNIKGVVKAVQALFPDGMIIAHPLLHVDFNQPGAMAFSSNDPSLISEATAKKTVGIYQAWSESKAGKEELNASLKELFDRQWYMGVLLALVQFKWIEREAGDGMKKKL
ncbi:hypothetical protein P7C73_g3753, partial [Tremellales sp. Uapishka_1]